MRETLHSILKRVLNKLSFDVDFPLCLELLEKVTDTFCYDSYQIKSCFKLVSVSIIVIRASVRAIFIISDT